ncbi:MAG: NifB/NifX family molybdenum-iron cluster-binding protein [Methanoculleaceae archaeon]
MKVCITAKGPDPESNVEGRFGRAPYFVIYDDGAKSWDNVKNPFTDAMGGVGPRAAQILIDNGVSVLITGNVGGNALNALKTAGIAIYFFKDQRTVRDAYDAFSNGSLQRFA